MTTLHEAARAELIEALSEARQTYGRPGTRDVDVTAWNKRIDRALAALAASEAQAEPVGHVRIDSGEVHIVPKVRDAELSALRDGQSVYTHPAAPQQPPVSLLWQVRKALARAAAICDAVPNRQDGHLGALVNPQPDGTHGYREIHEAEAALVAYLTTPEAAPQQPAPADPLMSREELIAAAESIGMRFPPLELPEQPAPAERGEQTAPTKAERVHALVNGGPFPGMSEAFDAHMGVGCWVDLAYRQDAATWAAAWKAALASAPRVPQGWKLVPVEPTEAMVLAAWGAAQDDADPRDPGSIAAWGRMLDAAPQPEGGA